jgi:sugar phosphate isomerase/epimerase
MKLGYLTKYSADEAARAARLGFDCLEVHANSVCDDLADHAKCRTAGKEARRVTDGAGVSVSAVSYYANVLEGEPKTELARFGGAFEIAAALGTNVVATLAGAVRDLPTEDNLRRFPDFFGPIAAAAGKAGMRLAMENWPGFGGGLPLKSSNLARTPALWQKLLEAVDDEALGLEFDPSHLVRMGVPHMPALKEFGRRVYHVHAKDTEMLNDSIARNGWIDVRPFRYRIPGYGQVNWAEFIAGLVEIGYDGGVAIEHEDPVFSGPRFEEGLVRGLRALRPLILA